MIQNKEIKFQKMEILTKEMLDELQNFPKSMIDISFSEYSDGIINGFKFLREGGILFLTKGIIKLKGKYYLMKDNFNITELIIGKESRKKNIFYRIILKLDENESIVGRGVEIESLKLALIEGRDEGEEEFLLGSFYLINEKELKLPENFEELSDKYINISKVKYSSKNSQGTLHPQLLEIILKKIRELPNKNSLDYSFLTQGMNSERIERDFLKFYCEEQKNLNKLFYEDENYWDDNEVLVIRLKKATESRRKQLIELEKLPEKSPEKFKI